MVVDFQHHYTPPELVGLDVVKAMSINTRGATPPYRMPPALTDLETHLRDMDASGIDHAVLSCGLGMDGTTVEICRLVNAAMAKAVAQAPRRISSLAHTVPLGGKDALAELARCKDEYGFPGVVIVSEPDGLPLDAPRLDPFWRECERLDLYVFVHPALRPDVGRMMDKYDLVRSLGREYSMSTATVRLINGGVLDRYPALRIQMAHLAGGLAMAMDRVRALQDKERLGTSGDPLHGILPEREFDYYLRERIVFDTAGIFGSIPAVQAAIREFSAERLVLGTDYPLEIRDAEEMAVFTTRLRTMGEDGRKVLEGNVGKLLTAEAS